ncbi:beta-ketoacyl synthase N-terminal-like domain-containing protein, partial [Actibacterium sp.]|uniref:beta-ketoacyl synthase N-terminal-like domain-containing protein n=1 Tax=Actibacterium sp. TaxID=1872125 RepID=UPI003563B4DD
MTTKGNGMSGKIAIIGMSCLFPGSDGPKRYWQNICAKADQVSDPPENWGAERYLNGKGANKITTAKGGFLKDLFRFDPAKLGVMPSSVDGSEPDHFLALQAAIATLA